MKPIFLYIALLFTTTIQAQDQFQIYDFYSDNILLEARTQEIFNGYNDQERVAQMIMQAVGDFGKPEADILQLVKNHQIGGVLFLKGEKSYFTSLYKKIKTLSFERNAFPQFITADAEPSLINRKIIGTQIVSKTNQLTSSEANIAACNSICQDLNEIGINWNFAPDCDININKAIIGNRSYGVDIPTIVERSREFIQTSEQHNILTSIKHFPGHGNVQGDSHKGLVYIDNEMKELDTYRQLIAQGAMSIMVGHIAVRNHPHYSTQGVPASCSPLIVTQLLREEMGFRGIIITDAMNMGAITTVEKTPSYKAVKAGVDIVLMPNGEQKLIDLIKAEMNTKPEFRDRIYDSVRRIIRMKLCLGLYNQ